MNQPICRYPLTPMTTVAARRNGCDGESCSTLGANDGIAFAKLYTISAAQPSIQCFRYDFRYCR